MHSFCNESVKLFIEQIIEGTDGGESNVADEYNANEFYSDWITEMLATVCSHYSWPLEVAKTMTYFRFYNFFNIAIREKEEKARNELRNTAIVKHSIETTIMGALGFDGELPSIAEYLDRFGVGTGETIEEDERTIEELMADIDAAFENLD